MAINAAAHGADMHWAAEDIGATDGAKAALWTDRISAYVLKNSTGNLDPDAFGNPAQGVIRRDNIIGTKPAAEFESSFKLKWEDNLFWQPALDFAGETVAVVYRSDALPANYQTLSDMWSVDDGEFGFWLQSGGIEPYVSDRDWLNEDYTLIPPGAAGAPPVIAGSHVLLARRDAGGFQVWEDGAQHKNVPLNLTNHPLLTNMQLGGGSTTFFIAEHVHLPFYADDAQANDLMYALSQEYGTAFHGTVPAPPPVTVPTSVTVAGAGTAPVDAQRTPVGIPTGLKRRLQQRRF